MTNAAFARTTLEAIWKEVLGDAYASGTHDMSFFEFGGSSIQLLELSRRIMAAFDVKIPLRQLFEFSTIEQQVSLVEGLRGTGAEEVPPPARGGARPTAHGDRALVPQQAVKLRRLKTSSGGRRVFAALRVDGSFDPHRLFDAFRAVVTSRDALCGTFAWREGEPVWRTLPAQDMRFEAPHVEAVSDEDEALAYLAGQAERELAPWEGQLARLSVARVDETTHYVLMVVSHLAVDGWSLGVLLDQLAQEYSGAAADVADLPSFYDWAEHYNSQIAERGGMAGVVRDWREYLGPPPYQRGTPMPPAVPGAERGCTKAYVRLDAATTQLLRRAAARHDATVFSLLVAALHRQESDGSRHDLQYSTATSVRHELGSEHIAGLLSDARVLVRCVSAPDTPAAAALVETERSRRQALGLLAPPYRTLRAHMGEDVLDESTTPYVALNPAWLSTPRKMGSAIATPAPLTAPEDYPKYVQYWWTDEGEQLVCTLRVPSDRFTPGQADALLRRTVDSTLAFARACDT
ncbi:hypothetical protein AQI95_41480 [Streptomyces yokosukanensis]|uniref:Carrier domain-containing protein n=1 Tax=Streptomyces yokosukanensis TaxID=67386 RepID=A0A117PYF8_9ACTN|nr:condensation domain-containing protein [Streptomyces yokosukanensis]KUM98063.1 hypothetical protein AQI95_41480 [Streptomyces yokosukanensis]